MKISLTVILLGHFCRGFGPPTPPAPPTPPCRCLNAPSLVPFGTLCSQPNAFIVYTPADYMPFAQACSLDSPVSVSSPSSPHLAVQGSDVDLVQRLATNLSVGLPRQLQLCFVQSPWASLVSNAVLGGFDLGVGGITNTTNRSAFVAFTPALLPAGKVVVAQPQSAVRSMIADWGLQEGMARLASLGPALTVAVNAGGTNQKAVEAAFPRATVRVVGENGAQYGLLLSGAANLTLTDAVECQVFALREGGGQLWCGPDVVPEHGLGVAWMMPRMPKSLKSAWNAEVDEFVRNGLTNGDFNATLQDWVQYFGRVA